MNGAERLCDALLVNAIDTCFANPGTSEMHFVAALDRKPKMRCILGLFEGVVTGAADGYARMVDRPAATLLHTGPGLANGLANLHNARRARSPIVNVVGDHASYHLPYNAPLTSDIDALAAPMSDWVRRIEGAGDVIGAAEAAITAARTLPGIATLILPGDAAWSDCPAEQPDPVALSFQPPAAVDERTIRAVATALRQAKGRCGLMLGGAAARTGALDIAGRIAAATGARLFGGMFIARVERGQGRVPIERIPYPVDQALEVLRDIDLMVLVGAPAPVAFFAYPGKPSGLMRAGAEVMTLAVPGQDLVGALDALADFLGGPGGEKLLPAPAPGLDAAPNGALTDEAMSRIVAQLLPEGTILIDEALTSARAVYALTEGAAPHDYVMACTGGAIGAGPPVATGAAVACPDRKVLNLQADGSGMYTVQALWTQARENLDVVTIVYANRAYAILQTEMRNVGVNSFGRNADRMLRLDEPVLDWVSLANGMGVEGASVETAEGFYSVLDYALARKGPFLIEAVI